MTASTPNALLRQREWRTRNAEACKKKAREYYQKNKTQKTAYMRKWRAENLDRIKDKELEKSRRYRERNRETVRSRQWAFRGQPPPTRPRPEICELCGGPPNGRGVLHLDHCHETGRFRGWLCSWCNTGLGKFGDNEKGLMKALSYLRRGFS